MGRKIPAKKHRGVKDPLAQQAKRLESLKGKINAPPKDPDEQPMPQSLIKLFGLQDPNKKNTTKKKNDNKFRHLIHKKDDNKKSTSSNPISQLRKLPGESGRDFSLRINSAVKALHGPEEDLDYPQDMEAEDHKGRRMAEQRERRAKKRRRAERAGQGGGATVEPAPTRTQRRALKRQADKLKALEDSRERAELHYEPVQFGDVTHAPPDLRPAPRPGRRDLLLSSMLSPPPAEVARLEAVAAYRAMKAVRRGRR